MNIDDMSERIRVVADDLDEVACRRATVGEYLAAIRDARAALEEIIDNAPMPTLEPK